MIDRKSAMTSRSTLVVLFAVRVPTVLLLIALTSNFSINAASSLTVDLKILWLAATRTIIPSRNNSTPWVASNLQLITLGKRKFVKNRLHSFVQHVTLVGTIENNVMNRLIILCMSESYRSWSLCDRCRIFISRSTRAWNNVTSMIPFGSKSNIAQIVSIVAPFCILILLLVVALDEHESNKSTNCSHSWRKKCSFGVVASSDTLLVDGVFLVTNAWAKRNAADE